MKLIVLSIGKNICQYVIKNKKGNIAVSFFPKKKN